MSTSKISFNGAPRLGLGDGFKGADLAVANISASMGLRDWVSEMACAGRTYPNERAAASMGLRDWVSEMAAVEDLRRL